MEVKVLKEQELSDNLYENVLIHGDCLKVMDRLPSESYDMVFIDPPYFLQLPKGRKLKRWEVKTEVNGVEEEWDRFESFEEYDKFVMGVLSRVKKLLKPNGTLWVIGTYHSIYRWGKIMQDMGFWILNDVIWLKTNPMPNWLGVRFTNATETLLWAVKDKKVKGYTILDPMAGVGTTGVVAYKLGRRFTLIEKEERYVEWTVKRLSKVIIGLLYV
jgi:DNA modification methylase